MEAVKRAGSPKGVSVTAQDLFKQVMRDQVGPGLRAMGFRGSYTRSASSKMAPRHVTNGGRVRIRKSSAQFRSNPTPNTQHRGQPPACQGWGWRWRSVAFMRTQPTDEPYEVIHIGEHAAAVVPVDDLRKLRAIARHASPEALEAAELEEAAEIRRQTDEWIAAGRQGALSHEAFRKVLLGEAGA